MRVFLDFEASSLGKTGYPIEVAWVFEDGTSETHLIKPAPRWTDWDEEAEAVHGISRRMLEAQGTGHDVVARRMVDQLSSHALYASAPSWDGKWLSALLRAAGLPRHALRLKDSEEAQFETAVELLQPVVTGPEFGTVVAALLEQSRACAAPEQARHRALADAEAERQIWLEVRRAAAEEASARSSR